MKEIYACLCNKKVPIRLLLIELGKDIWILFIIIIIVNSKVILTKENLQDIYIKIFTKIQIWNIRKILTIWPKGLIGTIGPIGLISPIRKISPIWRILQIWWILRIWQIWRRSNYADPSVIRSEISSPLTT